MQAPGSGLGLSIVYRILELQRGTVQFDAPPTGSGLQVTVALPLVRDARF
jgi:two-component system sensor histidine kinase QseC